MQNVTAIFNKACDLGMALGWENISMTEGCHELQIDGGWWMAINPHREHTACSHGYKVPPFAIYFEWHGYPAGYVNAQGGILACGDKANEGALLRTMDAAIARAGMAGA